MVDDKGNILIPYREWEIKEYDLGIAKVLLKIASKTACSIIYAYKTGFVGSDGNFIGGFQIDFDEFEPQAAPNLTIIHRTENPYRGTTNRAKYDAWEAQQRADERRRQREAEQKKKEEELKRKQCQQAANEWKRSIISRYQ